MMMSRATVALLAVADLQSGDIIGAPEVMAERLADLGLAEGWSRTGSYRNCISGAVSHCVRVHLSEDGFVEAMKAKLELYSAAFGPLPGPGHVEAAWRGRDDHEDNRG